jgi:hypothetical protein
MKQPIMKTTFSGAEGQSLIANLQAGIQNDNLYVANSIVKAADVCNLPTRSGYDQAIISGGEIVNWVGKNYGHLSNLHFFGEMEKKLLETDINVLTRSFNRKNRAFAADYILNDDSFHIDMKVGKKSDIIRPMISLTNGYDGSTQVMGRFGFYREVCKNGMHVLTSEIGFKTRHTGNIMEVVMPQMDVLIQTFMNNQFFELKKKFVVLAETPITDIKNYVRMTCADLGIFKYEKSEENEEASSNAVAVMETITKECRALDIKPNMFIGYNAFNFVLHNKMKKGFNSGYDMDAKLFDYNYEMASSN